jgi:hypothetical protein
MPAPNSVRRTGEGATPAPAEFPGPAETGTPPGDKAHGPVGAAEHSHRSDVAALRQWINHPDLRAEVPVPDLTAEHKGNGFQKAVAAYQAAAATAAPTPPADPAPVVTDPAPVVTDPAPVVTDPAPVVTDPAPVVTDPAPVATDAAPVVPNEPAV